MSLAIASIALYGAGITSTISPCVVPLVPGYLGVLVDGSAGRRERAQRVVVFALGAIATFVALGAVAAAVGLPLSVTIGWIQRLAGLCLIVLGALMILGRRGRVVREFRLVRALPAQPHVRALLLGIGCGAAWSPCVGPLLGAALTAAAASGSTWRGSWLLFAFGCGVLTPFCGLACVRVPTLGGRLRSMGEGCRRYRPSSWSCSARCCWQGGMTSSFSGSTSVRSRAHRCRCTTGAAG